MAGKAGETYNNLIDQCIEYEINPELADSSGEIFRRLLMDYFFRKEMEESKSIEQFFEKFEIPEFITGIQSILDIDINRLVSYVSGETINDSLCGRIMLSKSFIRNYYPGQDPVFANLSDDIKFELVDRIKEKNNKIISAFEKMANDREADKKRTVITLISLIIKNVYKKSGRPINRKVVSVEETIKSIFPDTGERFTGNQRQMSLLTDDSRVKELVKGMFIIKQYKDIEEVAGLFMRELDRYKKRSLRSAG